MDKETTTASVETEDLRAETAMKRGAADVILLVEDDPDQFIITQRRLRTAGIANPVARCETGEEVLEYLHRQGRYADAVRPGIILLDVNLPGLEGTEVLKAIKAEPELGDIPVIMLTGSSDGRETSLCRELGAVAFMAKPLEPDAFVHTVNELPGVHFRLRLHARPK